MEHDKGGQRERDNAEDEGAEEGGPAEAEKEVIITTTTFLVSQRRDRARGGPAQGVTVF